MARSEFDRRDGAAIAVLSCMAVLLFWRPLFTSDSLYFRDIFNFSYPHAQLIHEVCRHGQLPYWNYFFNCGQPLLSNPNTLFFYPYTLVMIFLPVDLAFPLFYVVHFAIAAAGTYFLARRWEQTRLAALFAAACFLLSGPIVSLGNFYNFLACAAWIPWALVLTDYAVEGRSPRPWILLTGVFALQVLAGEPMTLMATFGLAVAYAFHRNGNFRRPFSAANLRLLTAFLLVGLLTMALAAFQFFPSLELLANSRRGQGLGFEAAVPWSFHPLLLLETVIPNFFGPPLGDPGQWKSILNGGGDPLLLSYFLGVIPFLFVLAGWGISKNSRRNFAAAGAMVFLVLSFGAFTPIYKLVYWAFPPLHLVRFPVKLLVPATLLIVLLAGWGFDSLRGDEARVSGGKWKVLIPLGSLFVSSFVIWVAAWLEPGWIEGLSGRLLDWTFKASIWNPNLGTNPTQLEQAMRAFVLTVRGRFPDFFALALVGLAWLYALWKNRVWAGRATPWVALCGLAFLALVNIDVNPTAHKSFYDYRPPFFQYLQSSGQSFRFCNLSFDQLEPHRQPEAQDMLDFSSLPEARSFRGPLAVSFRDKIQLEKGSMLARFESASYADIEGTLPPAYHEFWSFEKGQVDDKARYDCLLGRANVKYLISYTPEDSAATREVTRIFNGSPSPGFLYEDFCATPLAYAAGAALYLNSPQKALANLSDPTFPATQNVLLSGRSDSLEGIPGTVGRVEILGRDTGQVTLSADLDRPGYVVLLDRYDPDWHATLDGREVPMLVANVMFRAVACPQGHHQIRFVYRQRGLRAGVTLSIITLIFLLLVYWRNPRSST